MLILMQVAVNKAMAAYPVRQATHWGYPIH